MSDPVLALFEQELTRRGVLFRLDDESHRRHSTPSFTCVLNGIEPEAYLRDVLARIGDYPINRLHELLPWNIAGQTTRNLAA